MPLGTMSVVVYKNKIIGDHQYEYETQYLRPQHLELPDHGPKITEL